MKSIMVPSDLVGEELSAVCFVRDYVELHFDGPLLRALTNIEVTRPDIRKTFPEPGSRDAICALIGMRITSLDMRASHGVCITFEDSSAILIPLATDAESGPEAAHFVPGENAPIQIW